MERTTEFQVGPKDIDFLGHVNNVKYLYYLEHARDAWYGAPRAVGMPNNITPVIVNVNVNFRQEARLGEKLTIFTKTARIGTSSISLKQVIKNEKDQLIADADSTLVLFHLDDRKSVPMPQTLIDYLSTGS